MTRTSRSVCLLAALALQATTVAAEVPEQYAVHFGFGTTHINNSHPRGLSTPQVDGGFLIPSFGWFTTDRKSFFDYRMTPVYWDIVAGLSYAPDDMDEGYLSSGILGHFVYGRHLLPVGPLTLGAGLSFGEYGFDSESFDEGYYLTVGPALRANLHLEDLLTANLTTRYDWAAHHVIPGDRTGPNESDADAFLALTLQVIPYAVSSRFYVDIEYWKVLTGNKALRYNPETFGNVESDVDVNRLTIQAGLRFITFDDF